MKLITKYLTGLHNVRPGTVAHKCTLNSKWHSKFKNRRQFWRHHSEFENYTLNSKNISLHSKTSLRIIFENITLNSKTSLPIRKHPALNLKTPLRIPELHSELENMTPNLKMPLRILKLYSNFEHITPKSKTPLPIWKLHSKFESFTPRTSKHPLPFQCRVYVGKQDNTVYKGIQGIIIVLLG